jgi:hypothetical protein
MHSCCRRLFTFSRSAEDSSKSYQLTASFLIKEQETTLKVAVLVTPFAALNTD